MAAVLALVFRRRLRLVPLAVALGAVALTFGLMALVGAPLTMASIAVLPVLLGLGVDYAIQYQARIGDPPTPAAVERAARAGLPTIATAALATAAGFLVLLLSPVPMVRGFGALLVVGVGVAFACALTGGTAALVTLGRRRRRAGAARALGARGRRAARRRRAPGRRGSARPAGRLGEAVLRRRRSRGPGACWRSGSPSRRSAGSPTRRPRCAPTCRRSCRRTCRRCATSTRCSARPASPARWTSSSRGATWATRRSSRGCARSSSACCARPATRRTERLRQGRAVPGAVAARPVPGRRRSGPREDRRAARRRPAVLLPGRHHRRPAHRQPRVRDPAHAARRAARGDRAGARRARPARGRHRARRRAAGAGRRGERRARVAVAADRDAAGRACSPSGSCCSLVHRRLERAWVPLVPIALATGWSAAVLFALRIPLNPMSATLGALVIALSTEFAVLLDGRYREERAAGHGPPRPCGGRTRRRARRCSRRARPRSRASPCSRSPTCGCCRSSAS